MEPDPGLSAVLPELVRREPLFHRPEFGTRRADFESLIAPDYFEVGASGRRYSRDFVLDELERRHATPHADVWRTSDFHCRRLGPDVYLLTYTLVQGADRRTRRSTIWQHSTSGWQAVYHQGTLVADPLPRPQAPR